MRGWAGWEVGVAWGAEPRGLRGVFGAVGSSSVTNGGNWGAGA